MTLIAVGPKFSSHKDKFGKLRASKDKAYGIWNTFAAPVLLSAALPPSARGVGGGGVAFVSSWLLFDVVVTELQ